MRTDDDLEYNWKRLRKICTNTIVSDVRFWQYVGTSPALGASSVSSQREFWLIQQNVKLPKLFKCWFDPTLSALAHYTAILHAADQCRAQAPLWPPLPLCIFDGIQMFWLYLYKSEKLVNSENNGLQFSTNQCSSFIPNVETKIYLSGVVIVQSMTQQFVINQPYFDLSMWGFLVSNLNRIPWWEMLACPTSSLAWEQEEQSRMQFVNSAIYKPGVFG